MSRPTKSRIIINVGLVLLLVALVLMVGVAITGMWIGIQNVGWFPIKLGVTIGGVGAVLSLVGMAVESWND